MAAKSKPPREFLARLGAANDQARRALVDLLANAPAMMKLVQTDPEAAQARLSEIHARYSDVAEKSAQAIEPMAREFLAEIRQPGEPPQDFLTRVTRKTEDLFPEGFRDRAAGLEAVVREAKQRARKLSRRGGTS